MSITGELTPTQRQCIERSRAFRASIAARAVPQKPAPERSFAVKGCLPQAPKPVLEEPPQAVLDPPPGSVFFQIVDEMDGYPTIRKIQKVVCAHYKISLCDMLSKRRTWNIVVPRHVAMFLCKELTPRSLPYIARRFGGMDHTTVLHAVRKIGNWIKCGRHDVAADIALLRTQLEVQEA